MAAGPFKAAAWELFGTDWNDRGRARPRNRSKKVTMWGGWFAIAADNGMGAGMKKLDALTSVRFFFAMMVVIGHFDGHFADAIGPVPGFVYNMATLAVAWFFVLSGFIIAYNYPRLDTNRARRDFLALRIARLWPVHAAILTAALAFRLYYLNPHWLMFHYTMTQSWSLSPDIAAAYNGPAWSISCEFFFYIAYVAMVAPWRWLRILVIAGSVIGAMLPLMYGWLDPGAVGTPTYNYLVFMFPPSRLIEFVAGAALCRLKPRVPQILGLAAAVAVFSCALPVPDLGALGNAVVREILIVVGGGALIASLARDGWLARVLSFPLLVIGGEISYSIYMSHQVINEVVLPRLHGWGLWATFGIVTSVTLLASALLFYVVEAPCRDAVKRALKRGRANLLSSSAAPQSAKAAYRPVP
jgi:peptidoglycan/LPS O-acetylase OafA/YrhL